MEYHFSEIEKKWQQVWAARKTYKTSNASSKPKYYVLDMFPYPSGAGLHVGHPLGYIASDIFSRYKRLKGFNVLHPMGYDSFGLPAEQYAIQTGQHPAITTEENVKRYREQLDKLGFSFDWDREVRTSDPSFYRWTQWIFVQLFHSWYNKTADKAESIEGLIAQFESKGCEGDFHEVLTGDIEAELSPFTAEEWRNFDEARKQAILMHFRLAYQSESYVNWCPALGTVLANDEVKEGVSERGGHPVERKLMMQWSLRITAYSDRLLNDLNNIDWSDSLKEAQRNWIGKSEGTSLRFGLTPTSPNLAEAFIEVFTTRPDTVFGVSFLTLAPEHELVNQITTEEYKARVEEYVTLAKNRSERERMADVKKISGQFTGAYAVHPFTGKPIPVWIGDYVLAGYGTGAVMAVPAHDSRDHAFAKHFDLTIPQVVEGGDVSKEAYEEKEGKIINSDFLNGLEVKVAIKKAIEVIEQKKLGKRKVNFRLRDAIFGRQRYWGEPIPVYYKHGIAYTIPEKDLPLLLPEVDKFLPTETGEPPLARAKNFTHQGFPIETTTMPGWAGSSWYFLRYMMEDVKNRKGEKDTEFVSKEAVNYWQNVDLYIGGSEHATGHLLYVRFWTKFLYDLGYVPQHEPAKKLINQGMIQGTSSIVYRINGQNKFVSHGLKKDYETTALHVDVNIVHNSILDIEAFKKWRVEFETAEFMLEDGKYICGSEIEKMSKRWFNVVNPDDMCNKYGADAFRLYEMFLGPLELSKPWNTNGITGVSGFLRKLWKLYHGGEGFLISNEPATKPELKALHKLIKKITDDIERFSFNTSVSNFMICVNELTDLKCNKREILEPLAILISPYAPHISEELWCKLKYGKTLNTADLPSDYESITYASFPEYNEAHMVENSFEYPVSFNGKTRFKIELPLSLNAQEVEKEVLSTEEAKKYLEGKTPKKVIVVPNRIVNIVM
jgi:leucyl-tRNA synthetase